MLYEPFSIYSLGAQSGSEDLVSGAGGGGGGGSMGAFVLLPSLTFRMSSGLKATGCCLGTDCLGTVEVVVFLTVE